jgi:hypothetical protein
MPEDQKAEEQNSDATGAAVDGSAPQKENSQDNGINDTTRSQQQSKPNKGVEREFFNLRQKKRELSTEVEELRAQLAQLQQSSGKQDREPDPDASAVDIRRELEQLKSSLIQEFEGREQAKAIKAQERAADQWLLDRQYISEDPAFADTVAGLIHSKYQHIAKADPMAAARLAYQDVCDLKGVSSDMHDYSGAAKASGGLGSSAPTGSSPKTRVKDYGELRKAYDLSDPEQRAKAKARLESLKKGED